MGPWAWRPPVSFIVSTTSIVARSNSSIGSSMGESLGQYFRRGRDKKGWTLEEAASKTRILPQYLQAVEDDNYEQLPAEVFAKGFIRSYARSLGRNESEVLAKFNESGGQCYALRDEREERQQRSVAEARRKKANKLIVA